jgi:hypothetical protein
MEAKLLTGNGLHQKGICLYKVTVRGHLRYVVGVGDTGKIKYAEFVGAGSGQVRFSHFAECEGKSLLNWADGIQDLTPDERSALQARIKEVQEHQQYIEKRIAEEE